MGRSLLTTIFRRGVIDLEAKFEPNLLNTAIYLLSLSQQVSTFAINFQGRPFREGIRENSALYWGLVGAEAVAFSGSTDFMPELNRWLQIVEMKDIVSSILPFIPDMPLSFLHCSVQIQVDGSHGHRLPGMFLHRAGVQASVREPRTEADGHAWA